MGEFVIGVIVTLVAVLIFLVGHAAGSGEIATECQRLGSFYVSNTTFECRPVEKIK